MERRLVGIVSLTLAIGLLVGSIVTYGALQWTWKITASVTIKTLGVSAYSDQSCTIPLLTIDWGIMEAGQTKNYSAYIKNESNVPVTMSMYVDNWNPTNAKDFMSLSWNYDNNPIPIDGVVPIDFSLSVNSSIVGIRNFSFEIWVVGSG